MHIDILATFLFDFFFLIDNLFKKAKTLYMM